MEGFLSEDVEDSSSGTTERRDSSSSSSMKDCGDIISMGFIVEVAEGLAAENRDVKLSPGADRNDSAGEFSNFVIGEGCSNAMVATVGWCEGLLDLTGLLLGPR